GPTRVVQEYPGHGHPEARLRTGTGRRLRHDRVEEVPARCDEQVDTGLVLDHPADRLPLGRERDPADGRRATVQYGVEQPPAVQLYHAGPGDLVRGQRVRGKYRPIDENDVVPLPGKQERGGGTGGAGADHDDVVAVTGRSHTFVSTV